MYFSIYLANNPDQQRSRIESERQNLMQLRFHEGFRPNQTLGMPMPYSNVGWKLTIPDSDCPYPPIVENSPQCSNSPNRTNNTQPSEQDFDSPPRYDETLMS